LCRTVTDVTKKIERAELLAIGTELLVGETRDTNSGDLARQLTALGVEVQRTTALPDRLGPVAEAFRAALERADLVVCTGGLGPTPDDLTREAIAQVVGAEPTVDPELEAWLRGLFERRGLPFVEANLKQAWLVDGAIGLPNPNGTAPGWWVDLPGEKVIVALPGPPREMQPMWRDHVLPRLHARGLGRDTAAQTLRLTGIGESALVGLIGDEVLRRRNPEVATYARVDAVDVRVSAEAEGGRTAAELLETALGELLPALQPYIFARGDETWPDAIGKRLDGRTAAFVEVGTGGQVAALIGSAAWLLLGELLAPDGALARSHEHMEDFARQARTVAGSDVGLAVRARERDGDMAVTVAVALGDDVTQVTRTAFLGGEMGRRRAALIAAAELWKRLGE
jgi:nicotinamide-nucleotide amidase